VSIASSSERKSAFRNQKPRPDYVPGVVVCRVAEDTVANVVDMDATPRASVRAARMPDTIYRPLQRLITSRQIQDAEPLFSRRPEHHERPTMRSLDLPSSAAVAQVFAASVRDSESEQLRGLVVLRVAKNADPQALAKDLQAADGIDYAHAVPARWPQASRTRKTGPDPFLNRQWGLRAVKYFETKIPDAKQVRVAVLDTGIDQSHPDLAGAVANYDHGNATAEDIVGHGTHVAGIIAARTNNAIGMAGIADPELHIWKIFPDEPAADGQYYVDETMYLRALNAVRTTGIRVVNLSIGGPRFDQTEALLFRLLNDDGISVVAAMGNAFEDGNPKEYPGGHDGSIAIGAINEANRRAHFSSTGDHIALSAPGMNILSTLPMKTSAVRDGTDTEYNAWSGTSMATPHVAAAAALILTKHNAFDGQQVKKHLQKSAAELPVMLGRQFTETVGAGLLDIKAALS
jgi:subtilisin family serine protease